MISLSMSFQLHKEMWTEIVGLKPQRQMRNKYVAVLNKLIVLPFWAIYITGGDEDRYGKTFYLFIIITLTDRMTIDQGTTFQT